MRSVCEISDDLCWWRYQLNSLGFFQSLCAHACAHTHTQFQVCCVDKQLSRTAQPELSIKAKQTTQRLISEQTLRIPDCSIYFASQPLACKLILFLIKYCRRLQLSFTSHMVLQFTVHSPGIGTVAVILSAVFLSLSTCHGGGRLSRGRYIVGIHCRH